MEEVDVWSAWENNYYLFFCKLDLIPPMNLARWKAINVSPACPLCQPTTLTGLYTCKYNKNSSRKWLTVVVTYFCFGHWLCASWPCDSMPWVLILLDITNVHTCTYMCFGLQPLFLSKFTYSTLKISAYYIIHRANPSYLCHNYYVPYIFSRRIKTLSWFQQPAE